MQGPHLRLLVRRASPYTSTHSRKGRRAVESCTRKTQLKTRCIGPTISIVRGERGAYSPHINGPNHGNGKAFPRLQSTLTRQNDGKGDDGDEGESFVSMLQNRCSLRWAAVTPRAVQVQQLVPAAPESDCCRNCSSTGATGQTGSTGATGETGAAGATAMTGNDEEPSETMDKVLTGQMAWRCLEK